MLEVERRLGARVRKQMEKTSASIICGSSSRPFKRSWGKGRRFEEADAFRQTLASLKLPDKVREKIAGRN